MPGVGAAGGEPPTVAMGTLVSAVAVLASARATGVAFANGWADLIFDFFVGGGGADFPAATGLGLGATTVFAPLFAKAVSSSAVGNSGTSSATNTALHLGHLPRFPAYWSGTRNA